MKYLFLVLFSFQFSIATQLEFTHESNIPASDFEEFTRYFNQDSTLGMNFTEVDSQLQLNIYNPSVQCLLKTGENLNFKCSAMQLKGRVLQRALKSHMNSYKRKEKSFLKEYQNGRYVSPEELEEMSEPLKIFVLVERYHLETLLNSRPSDTARFHPIGLGIEIGDVYGFSFQLTRHEFNSQSSNTSVTYTRIGGFSKVELQPEILFKWSVHYQLMFLGLVDGNRTYANGYNVSIGLASSEKRDIQFFAEYFLGYSYRGDTVEDIYEPSYTYDIDLGYLGSGIRIGMGFKI